jgi:hypothetical protein
MTAIHHDQRVKRWRGSRGSAGASPLAGWSRLMEPRSMPRICVDPGPRHGSQPHRNGAHCVAVRTMVAPDTTTEEANVKHRLEAEIRKSRVVDPSDRLHTVGLECVTMAAHRRRRRRSPRQRTQHRRTAHARPRRLSSRQAPRTCPELSPPPQSRMDFVLRLASAGWAESLRGALLDLTDPCRNLVARHRGHRWWFTAAATVCVVARHQIVRVLARIP